MATVSGSIFTYDLHTSASTTLEYKLDFSNIKSSEELRKEQLEKEIQHKKDCKLRNKLKRKQLFTKKNLY